jgi:hypothetical protein
MAEIIYKTESYAIVGACFEVYNEKGSGFLEPVYQECLAIEFEHRGNSKAITHTYLPQSDSNSDVCAGFCLLPKNHLGAKECFAINRRAPCAVIELSPRNWL